MELSTLEELIFQMPHSILPKKKKKKGVPASLAPAGHLPTSQPLPRLSALLFASLALPCLPQGHRPQLCHCTGLLSPVAKRKQEAKGLQGL